MFDAEKAREAIKAMPRPPEMDCPVCRSQRGYCAEHRPGPKRPHGHTVKCLDPVRADADCDVDDLTRIIKAGRVTPPDSGEKR
jgi:hypothetical protein